MSEAKIDRLMAAAIHQAIGDITPSRLEFYESYLRPRGWREDAVNLAPVAAVLSFLRHEPDGSYDAVMTRAAGYAADWVYDALPWRVRILGRAVAPRRARLRTLGRIGRAHLEGSYRGTRASATARRGTLEVEILGSIFCSTRDQASAPHCRYYLAFFERLLQRDGLTVVDAAIDACRAGGGPACRIRVVTDGGAAAPALRSSVEGDDAH
jgi:hypothetical protein